MNISLMSVKYKARVKLCLDVVSVETQGYQIWQPHCEVPASN